MKLVFTSLYLLLFCTILAFGQNNNTSTTDRRQGRINLDNSIGFGKYIFGSPVTLYKDLTYIPEPDEPYKKYQLAEIQLSYTPDYRIADRPKPNTSQQTYNLLKHHWGLGRLELVEEFKIILPNGRNRTLGIIDISVEGFAGTVVDSKVIFGAALTACASGIMLVHNHPSGEIEPS